MDMTMPNTAASAGMVAIPGRISVAECRRECPRPIRNCNGVS
jgi:hypothetical protein